MDNNILEKIHKSALRFLVPLDPLDIYQTIVQEAVKLVSAQYGSLLLERDSELSRVYTTLPIASQLKPRKNGFTYTCFREQKAIVKKSKDFTNSRPLWGLGLLSSIFIPVAYKGKSIGVLVINSYENIEFTEKELSILQLYGSLASLAIRKTQLYEETKKALETRDTFIAMAGHELKTPLTTIRGYAQMLESKFKDSDGPEKRWTRELNWESYRLAQLINELLAVNKTSIGELNYTLKECSLNELLSRSLSNFHFLHPSREIDFHNSTKTGKDIIIGDFDKLLQALDNILDNAAKFSPNGAPVSVSLSKQNKCFIIQVEDKGIGIDKKDLPLIFENYYRAKGHIVEGMGIGLYLTKNILQRHHITISIKSKSTKGTTVTIKLPEAKI
ncbi:MAG: GAF domain-containing sensor histidine kinase [Candidatus Daviesbacteria bacterium]|nr:GAF domain-containing sensor histidine kinase [Candidatus Daviesbacteria bacterium]